MRGINNRLSFLLRAKQMNRRNKMFIKKPVKLVNARIRNNRTHKNNSYLLFLCLIMINDMSKLRNITKPMLNNPVKSVIKAGVTDKIVMA
jgi:hypothetical protein